MTITIRVFTIPVLTIELDEMCGDPLITTPLDKGVKGMSRWWTRRMSK